MTIIDTNQDQAAWDKHRDTWVHFYDYYIRTGNLSYAYFLRLRASAPEADQALMVWGNEVYPAISAAWLDEHNTQRGNPLFADSEFQRRMAFRRWGRRH